MSPRMLIAVLACALALAGPAMAASEQAPEVKMAPRHTYEQAKRLVDRAVAHLKRVGSDKAFADFNDSAGRWVEDDLYVFVFDMKGVYKASGFKPERTGADAWKMKDASGRLYVVQEIVKKAKRDGEATVDYLWNNPATGKVENKTSYVVKAGDYVVGAGFYHQ